MRNMKITSAAVLAAAALLVTVAPGSAHAEPGPSGCRSFTGGWYSTKAQCTSGSGYVQAVAKCGNTWVTGAWTYIIGGDGRPATAIASCKVGLSPSGHSYNIKKY